ncbi:hypothetical protein PLESTF_000813200 [Pleodorina starrii]|nr:hypothetical protein PLESTM_001333900 [Pleodorina starrii]GLC69299.1 hypothetical protein PLESTF_000813200 [Pleodorina starrii]
MSFLSSRRDRRGLGLSSFGAHHDSRLPLDDCGSLSPAYLLETRDTSSNQSASSSAGSSETDIATLGSSSHASLFGRLAFQTSQTHITLSEGGCDDLLLERDLQSQVRSLDECRQHGGDVAAAALLDKALWCKHADRTSELQRGHSVEAQMVPATKGPGCPVAAEKPVYSSSSISCSFRCLGRSYSRRLSRLPEDEPLVPERLSPVVFSPAGRRSSGVASMIASPRRGSTGGILSPGGAAVPRVSHGSSSPGLPPEPLPKLPSPAASSSSSSGTMDPLRTAAASPTSSSPSQPAALTTAAFARFPTHLPSPLSTAPSEPNAKLDDTLSTATAFDATANCSPFAACAYHGAVALERELPDDSVHGGRPRHPSFDAAVPPRGSGLLERAESESAAASALRQLDLAGSAPVLAALAAAPAVIHDATPLAAPPPAPPRGLSPRLQVLLRTAPTWVLMLALLQRVARLCVTLPLLLIWVGLLRPIVARGWHGAGAGGASVMGSVGAAAPQRRSCQGKAEGRAGLRWERDVGRVRCSLAGGVKGVGGVGGGGGGGGGMQRPS